MTSRRLLHAAGATVLLGGLALGASSAAAQSPTAVAQPTRTQEFGLDAGATIGLGDESSVSIALPASRARVGFFLTADTRWSLEPAVGLNYRKVEGSDGSLNYDLEFGALYHFSPPTNLTGGLGGTGGPIVRSSVAYARPFIGLTGTTAGDGDTEVSVGGGLGIKVPWRESLAWRAEANLGYGFDNEALRIGALLGVSFFTRNLIR
ncbi:MAG: hypothetical protein ACXW0Z_09275 [Gemmatirosa sp.]